LYSSQPQLSDPSKLIPTYRITAGCVPETHYGIALARTVPLPHSVLDYATAVAEHLTQVNETNKQTSTAVLMQRKRRLILDLKEQLVQAKQARMPNEALRAHLQKLQASFIAKMAALEEQLQAGRDVDMSHAGADEEEGGPATPVGRSQREQGDQEMGESVNREGGERHVEGSSARSRSYRYGSSDLLQRS
jgi:DNA mismatch repair protein MSH4